MVPHMETFLGYSYVRFNSAANVPALEALRPEGHLSSLNPCNSQFLTPSLGLISFAIFGL